MAISDSAPRKWALYYNHAPMRASYNGITLASQACDTSREVYEFPCLTLSDESDSPPIIPQGMVNFDGVSRSSNCSAISEPMLGFQ